MNTMGENQNPSNTCLSVSQMDSSGTHLITHAQKNSSLVLIVIKCLVVCYEAQSSVTERPLTAGVWTRTVERLPEPDHMMLSNLHVSVLSTR